MDFSRAEHTIVLSDIHLSDAEPPHPKNPLWKRFKRPRYFIDRSFRDFLEHIAEKIETPIELILNGDIFDFDSVMAMPPQGTFHLNWLERARGLGPEEEKSRFKIRTILADHPVWTESVRNFVLAGNRVVFVIGNHDIELHWMKVRQDLVDCLELPPEHAKAVRFCEWFYISNQDTLVEHGNQYDAYTLTNNPINPWIKKGGKITIRLPFGNLAGKFMLNGMGLFNPHADSSFIRSSLSDYLRFYYKYILWTQPFLLIPWFWGALATVAISISESILPALKDPLSVGVQVEDIAARSNAPIAAVWTLKELHVHPATLNPFKILRELWLDRAIILALIVYVSFQFFSFINVFISVSFWWFIVPILLLLPLFIFYARSVESEVASMLSATAEHAPLAAKIAGVKRVVQGHTHIEKHRWILDVEYLNTGTWSPAFRDVECTERYGRKCFAWIRPGEAGRTADLFEWCDGDIRKIEPEA